MSSKAAHRYSADYAALRGQPKIRFLNTPAEVLRAQLRAWNAVTARALRDNPFFEKVLNSQQVWARRAAGWALDTLVDPRLAYDHWFARQAPAGTPGK
jgi:TRAP-type mannitol/chloroaromatic compound transport system substrate-binding protein